MLVKINRCPFCGGKAKISWYQCQFGGQSYDGGIKSIRWRVQVICNRCHSRGKPIKTGFINGLIPHFASEEARQVFFPYMTQAVDAWNASNPITPKEDATDV